jgi:hypothetical protein
MGHIVQHTYFRRRLSVQMSSFYLRSLASLTSIICIFQTLTFTLMAHRPRYRRSEATLGMYYIRFIYSKFRLAFLDFIKQISIFWPAGPRHRAYLNEYDAHSLYPLRFYFQYVFNSIYLVGFALITSFDFIICISTF